LLGKKPTSGLLENQVEVNTNLRAYAIFPIMSPSPLYLSPLCCLTCLFPAFLLGQTAETLIPPPPPMKEPGQGTREEAISAIKLMAEATAPWAPSAWSAERKPMRIQYSIRLDSD